MSMAHLRRHVVEPLYYLRSGSPRRAYWKELEESQYLAEEVLLERQWSRLKDMLGFAYTHNRFYRQRFDVAGLHPSDIRTPADMRGIPELTKREIRSRTSDMISDGYRIETLMRFKTGGSTGRALDIYLTEECSELRNACARRHDRWAGWEPGEPIGAVWGNPVVPTTIKAKLRDWLLNPLIYLDTMQVTEASVRCFAQNWIKLRPTLLYGHAHSLFVLAKYVRRLGIDSIHPKGILSTSMMLMPHERRTIEAVFGIPVTDRYGCEEVSLIGSECERHTGMHLNIEHLYIEFIRADGCPAEPGEMGTIVVTDLMNRAMPLIRYRIEDMGVPSDQHCACGRGLPIMERVVGRTADFLIRQDGSRVAGVSLIENTLTKIPGIDQMQIVQEALDHIVLHVVPSAGFSAATTNALSVYFREQFEGACIDLVTVKSIEPEPSGKYRFSICKVQRL